MTRQNGKVPKILKSRSSLIVSLDLLVLPQQRRNELIPDIPVDQLGDWGIEPGFIESWDQNENDRSLKRLVDHLRNGVCHFRIQAEGTEKDIQRLKFSDQRIQSHDTG